MRLFLSWSDWTTHYSAVLKQPAIRRKKTPVSKDTGATDAYNGRTD
jgi:hypothetical protein